MEAKTKKFRVVLLAILILSGIVVSFSVQGEVETTTLKVQGILSPL